jgi:hypothetical protein
LAASITDRPSHERHERERDADRRDVDRFDLEDGFFGTFAPACRASEMPIAIAWRRLVTFFPLPPLLSLPCFHSCMTRPTFFDAFLLYFGMTVLHEPALGPCGFRICRWSCGDGSMNRCSLIRVALLSWPSGNPHKQRLPSNEQQVKARADDRRNREPSLSSPG